MNWDECIKQKVKKTKPDPERAKSLKQLAEKRLYEIHKRRSDTYPEFIVEDYYETIKELITSLLYLEGYKSYSHECLITFLKKHYQQTINSGELELIDQLRRLRHDIMYRGSVVAEDYLDRNEEDINKVILKLTREIDKSSK